MMSIPFADEVPPDPPAPGTPGLPYTMTGDKSYAFAFSPSARRAGKPGTTDNGYVLTGKSLRIEARCFIKGFSDRVQIETNTSAVWQWRRIVFAETTHLLQDSFPSSTADFYEATAGQMRPLWNIRSGIGDASTAWDELKRILFAGKFGNDWANPHTAKTDTGRVTVFYDRTMKLTGGNNGRGTWKFQKFWHPINKTLIYNDDEEGAPPKFSDPWSSNKKGSMGDLIVLDIFDCADGAASDSANFGPEGTFYWHEH